MYILDIRSLVGKFIKATKGVLEIEDREIKRIYKNGLKKEGKG